MTSQATDLATGREELAGDLRRVGYLIGDLRGAERGGARSYFEKDLALTRPGILDRCADLMAAQVPTAADRLAAGGPAAVALATALSLRTGIALLFVDAGAETVAGDVFPGSGVVLVADILLTGETATRELAVLRSRAQRPLGVHILLDRERGGRARLESDGVPVRALFGESDLIPAV